MKPIDPLPGLLQEFFCRYMLEQRNLSAHTVRSYRDTWRLFLRFSATRHNRAVAKLVFDDLTAAMVGAFLQQCEQERKVTIGTRNCRLAALHASFLLSLNGSPYTLHSATQYCAFPPSVQLFARHATLIRMKLMPLERDNYRVRSLTTILAGSEESKAA